MRRTIFGFLAVSSFLACGQAELTAPPSPTPVVAKGIVTLSTSPTALSNANCSMANTDGSKKYGPVASGSEIRDVEAGRYEVTCSADGYQTAKGAPFYVKAGDQLTAVVSLSPNVPAVGTSATIWVNSSVPARVDSVVKYNTNGTRSSSTPTTSNTPYRTNVTADSSLYVFWVSAPGYVSLPVSSSPKPGDVVTLQANLSPIPPAPPPQTPRNTTGNLLIASNPSGMKALVYFVTSTGKDSLVRSVTTNITLTLLAGSYRVVCSQEPASAYGSVSVFSAVNVDENSTAVCMMPSIVAPPATPSVTLDLSKTTVNAGEEVKVTVSGTNTTSIFISPLSVNTVGGTFAFNPLGTTQVCAVGFGPGGVTVPVCKTVTVIPTVAGLIVDTVTFRFPDPTITVDDPRDWLWQTQPQINSTAFGPVVQIQMYVHLSTTKDESFAIRMQNGTVARPGISDWAGYVKPVAAISPVVSDIPGASGWTWVTVGVFTFENGKSYRPWGFHGSLFDSVTGIEGKFYTPKLPYGPVSFEGIRFIREKKP